MPLIDAKNLAVGYDGRTVQDGISFQVNPGDYVCIVGENGAGKSTLMKTILGLIKPVDGTIAMGDGLQQSEIGYLPQQSDAQKDFPASVREIVLSGCQGRCGSRPFYSKEEKQLADENIQIMGITHLAKACYRELSGGQQQRVLLARALCATKKCILLDEPVSGLDPKATCAMYELIKSLNDKGTAIIMVTHDINEALEYASHIVHVGSVPFYGTREEYLGSPYGRIFMAMKEGEGI